MHYQNHFIAQILPQPTKTAVKTIYIHDYNTKLIYKHMQNIK